MCSILPGINHIPTLVDFPLGEIRHVQISRVGKSAAVEFCTVINLQISDFSPREIRQCRKLVPPGGKSNACEFLHGINATGWNCSLRQMRRMRVSPREKCDTCEFLPGRNATRARFSRENFKCNTSEFLPGRNATHASFSRGEMRHMRVSPREKCDTCELLPGRNATHASLHGRNATHASFSLGEMRHMRVSPRLTILIGAVSGNHPWTFKFFKKKRYLHAWRFKSL